MRDRLNHLDVSYFRATRTAAAVSLAAWLASYFVIPGREHPGVRELCLVAMAWYTGTLVLTLWTARATIHRTVIFNIADEFLPLLAFAINPEIVLFFPIMFVILWIQIYFSVNVGLRWFHWYLRAVALVMATLGVALPVLHQPDHWPFAVMFNLTTFALLGLVFSTHAHRELVLGGLFRQLDVLQVNHSQVQHDLRNVLGVIALGSDQTPESRRAYRRLSRVVDLLAQARIETFPMSELLSDLVEDRTPSPTLRIDADFQVHANRRVLGNLLDNLARNAFEAGSRNVDFIAGGRTLRVVDDGPGFDPAQIRNGWTTKPKGTGRTLAKLLPEVCDLFGMTYSIDSAPGRGTTITLRFPETVEANTVG